jgi:hypothetical protein
MYWLLESDGMSDKREKTLGREEHVGLCIGFLKLPS